MTGLSHIFQPKAWVEFFIVVREKKEIGAIINGFIHYPLGAFIVAFHNVWVGIPLVLTLIGYALLLKGLICFVFPKLALASLNRVSIERAWEFVVAGFISVALGCLVLFSLVNK